MVKTLKTSLDYRSKAYIIKTKVIFLWHQVGFFKIIMCKTKTVDKLLSQFTVTATDKNMYTYLKKKPYQATRYFSSTRKMYES